MHRRKHKIIIFIVVPCIWLPGTQCTHMLPQYCKTYNDVFLLITATKM